MTKNFFYIINANYYKEISSRLLKGATSYCENNKIDYQVVEVPGALEIPFVAAKLAKDKKIDGAIALGAIIKGDTNHNELVSENAYNGCMQVSLNYNIPITLGIISADNLKLAQVRSQDIKADETHPDIKQPVNYGQSAAKAILDIFSLNL